MNKMDKPKKWVGKSILILILLFLLFRASSLFFGGLWFILKLYYFEDIERNILLFLIDLGKRILQ